MDEGYKNFHNAKALGGTIGISCYMCHPDASNTHPESYPKFQTQTKKTALLRDMINWCIENPLKSKPLDEDDPRLRSVEAYILSARKAVPLERGGAQASQETTAADRRDFRISIELAHLAHSCSAEGSFYPRSGGRHAREQAVSRSLFLAARLAL